VETIHIETTPCHEDTPDANLNFVMEMYLFQICMYGLTKQLLNLMVLSISPCGDRGKE
jgi:hypothetical protein